ncbi:DUF2190 family protein [Rhodococcus sp. D2-41]|uniref:capsid cement protein n=1 Tax=Speluncibacter jeojiensis TaxID=2710754 RepID=UPI00240EFCA1|nr:capsid cement protein [Rhodococcus sp. D2-41]MDG3012463.1 DUF2190 family protein [Rhodococcus sp. D2-41]
MTNECIPLYRPGQDVTATAGAAITGKTFVDITGALNATTGALLTVSPATAAGKAFGVAARDAASGGRVAVIRSAKVVIPVAAGGTFAVGDEVEVGAGAKAVKLASGTAVGRALTAGAANADAFIELY